jgi:bifunctional DNase/RNase
MGSRLVRAWTSTSLLLAALAAGCSDDTEKEIEVEVQRVAVDPSSQSPVILLEDKAHTMALPIWIGPAEAQAIAMQLEGVAPPRPMTHDLMKTILDEVGVKMVKVVIRELRDNTYHARIVLDRSGDRVEIDSRPSDAIALAVRCGQPIFVAPGVLQASNTIDLQALPPTRSLTMRGVTVQDLSEELAKHFELPPGHGVLVSDVADDSPDGGLRRGDVILEVDGKPVGNLDEFERRVRARGLLRLSVQRGDERIDVAFDASKH